jgi:NDP-sugar pyrophosphorylase family protein
MLPIAILAGGLATRLRPITETIPKALIEIAGEPFLGHQLRLLSRGGIRHAVLCVGYLGEQIREYAGDGSAFGMRVEYAFDGPQLLGTAGAIQRALPLLAEAEGADAFFAIYGDSYLPCDYGAVAKAFRDAAQPALMTVFRNQGQWDSSNVEFSGGRILAYDKANRTPRMQHIDYGLGVFRRQAFAHVPESQPYDLAALYQSLLRQGELAAWESPQRFYEIGSQAGIGELTEFLSR